MERAAVALGALALRQAKLAVFASMAQSFRDGSPCSGRRWSTSNNGARLRWKKSARHTHVEQITNEQIVKEFGEPEIAELQRKKAEVVVGLEYGLTDDTRRALNPWARRIIAKGKKVHARARRDHLQGEKIKKYWASPGEQV